MIVHVLYEVKETSPRVLWIASGESSTDKSAIEQKRLFKNVGWVQFLECFDIQGAVCQSLYFVSDHLSW